MTRRLKLYRLLCIVGAASLWLLVLWSLFLLRSFQGIRDHSYTETRYGMFAWLTVADRRVPPVSLGELLTKGSPFRPETHPWRVAATVIAALVATLLVLILIRRCIAVLTPLPSTFTECPLCGYSLYDGPERGCAECGWNRRRLS